MLAIRFDYLEIVEFLVQSGADLNLKDKVRELIHFLIIFIFCELFRKDELQKKLHKILVEKKLFKFSNKKLSINQKQKLEIIDL